MRAKDVAFIAAVLANEVEHAAPAEAAGLLAAVGAMRVAIEERQPEADVSALAAVEDALAGRLYGMCRVCGGNASERAHFSDGMCGPCRENSLAESARLAARIAAVEALIAVVDRTGPEIMKVIGTDTLSRLLLDAG